MSKSLLRQSSALLTCGAALILSAGLMSAAPALAYDKVVNKAVPNPGSKPAVSDTFKQDSKVAAQRTVKVMQTGTSDAAPAGPDTRLPPVDAHSPDEEDAGVIACKDKSDKDPALSVLPDDLRRNAKPGECYARLLKAPQQEAFTDHVLVSPEHTETRTVPAVVRTVEKDVMVQPERVERKVIPAVVSTRVETETVREATTRDEKIPGRYETQTVRELVEPPHDEWVKSEGEALDAPLVTPVDHAPVRYRADGYLSWPGKGKEGAPTTEEARDYLSKGNPPAVWCLKTIPGVYRDVRKRVMITPDSVRTVDVPAVTRQVTRKVVETPEHVEEHTITAVYQKRTVKEVVSPEHTETYTIPAVYKDVEKTRFTAPADAVWRRVLCRRNASSSLILHIQQALAAKGYNPGKIDGNLGASTTAAMQKFQADNNLPQGQISIESVSALGINPELAGDK